MLCQGIQQVSGILGKLCIVNCKLPLLHLFWWAQVELTCKTRFFVSVLLILPPSETFVLFLTVNSYASSSSVWNFVPRRKETPPMSIRYLPPTFVNYLSIVMNQVYSLLQTLILCLACTLWGIYSLHGTIRAGFDSNPQLNDKHQRTLNI